MANPPKAGVPAPDVFVSYSSRDRERVLPIVRSLRARGVSLWIDQDWIDAGQKYIDLIPQAIEDCKGLIFFASAAAFASEPVEREVLLASEFGKYLLPVMLEEVAIPGRFRFMLGAAQRVRLSGNDVDALVDAIGRGVRHWNLGAAPAKRTRIAPAERINVGELVPYLVNRIQQDRKIRAAFELHAEQTPRRPLVLLAHGFREHAIHQYVYRMEHSSVPDALQRVCGHDHVKWLELAFSSDDWQNHPKQTVAYLQQDVLDKLGARKTWPDGVVEATSRLRKMVVLCYRLTLYRLSDLHLATLRAWIDRWSELPDLPPRYPIVVFLAIEQTVRPTLLSRFGIGRPEPLSRQLAALGGSDRTDVPVVLLPELSNVTFDHLVQWVVRDVKPSKPARMIAQLERVMTDPLLLNGPGLPMSELTDRLTEIYEATVRAEEIA